MAELTTEEKVAIAGILGPAFSEKHGKMFRLLEEHEKLAKRYSCDLVLLADDGEVAKFEHTRTSGDTERERVRPARAGRVISILREDLTQRDVRGVFVSLNLHEPPADDREQRALGLQLASFVARRLRKRELVYFELDFRWEGELRRLSQWISRIEILPASDRDRTVIGWSTSQHMPVVSIPDDVRFREAAERKAEKYRQVGKDLCVIVEFDPRPVSDIYLPIIEDAERDETYPFREIWALNNCQADQRCWCLWTRRDGDGSSGDAR